MKYLVLLCLFVFATPVLAQTMRGTLALATSGQDCDEIGDLKAGLSHIFRAELVHKKVDDNLIVSPYVTKLIVTLGDEHTKVLADFRTDARVGDVVLPGHGEEIIGEVNAIYFGSKSVRYDTDEKGAGDEVRFTYVLDIDNFPVIKAIVSGSRASRARDCVISWIGKFSSQ